MSTSSVLFTADYIKSKSDRIANKHNIENLHKLYHEINEVLDKAAGNGKYGITLPKDIVSKYNNSVMSMAITELKNLGYKVEHSTTYPTYPGFPMEENIKISWS